jgi:MFS family permease
MTNVAPKNRAPAAVSHGREAGRTNTLWKAILVAALGYFVDIYDLVLFSIVRVESLKGIGVLTPQLLDSGVLLINMQMGGMLLGGIMWGVLGDKRGRLSILVASIATYSLANLANGFVQTLPQYAVLRFVAGIGLAGELGAGVTLVSELMSKEARGYGTTIIASVGLLGAVVAAFLGDELPWRASYIVGGMLGLVLLFLRIGVRESGMFEGIKHESVTKGNFLMLLKPPHVQRYLCLILVGVPGWYIMGILVTFAPELTRAMGMAELPKVSTAVIFTYTGLAVGGLLSGLLSQFLESRRRVVIIFLCSTAVFVALYFLVGRLSPAAFYAVCLALGISAGHWTVFMSMASELFGTNIRATASTSAPNFVRGAVVPMTFLFRFATGYIGIVGSAVVVGVAAVTAALVAVRFITETYGKDLNYVDR